MGKKALASVTNGRNNTTTNIYRGSPVDTISGNITTDINNSDPAVVTIGGITPTISKIPRGFPCDVTIFMTNTTHRGFPMVDIRDKNSTNTTSSLAAAVICLNFTTNNTTSRVAVGDICRKIHTNMLQIAPQDGLVAYWWGLMGLNYPYFVKRIVKTTYRWASLTPRRAFLLKSCVFSRCVMILLSLYFVRVFCFVFIFVRVFLIVFICS